MISFPIHYKQVHYSLTHPLHPSTFYLLYPYNQPIPKLQIDETYEWIFRFGKQLHIKAVSFRKIIVINLA